MLASVHVWTHVWTHGQTHVCAHARVINSSSAALNLSMLSMRSQEFTRVVSHMRIDPCTTTACIDARSILRGSHV